MALVLKDRVKVTTTTTGTGAFAIGGAQFGFQGFSAFADGDTTYYTAVDNATGAWETGLGTYSTTGPSLARTQVLASSTGTTISFGAGPKDLFVVYPAARAVLTDGAVFTGNLDVPSINGGQLAGMRNKIINGKMGIAQRGTSFVSPANGAYTLDRWQIGNTSSATFTISRQLGAADLLYSARIVVDTPDTSIAASDQTIFQQNIEGFNVYDLVGKTFTISFWVRSSVTGTYAIALRNSGFDRSYIATYTINASNTWEYKTVTVVGGLPASGGTWDFTNGAGLRVAWVLACGSSFQTSSGAWQTGNFLATSAQANVLATASNTFQITGVQLEIGEVATPFEHRPYGTELALCERYCQFADGGFTGAITPGGVYSGVIQLYPFMRTNPTAVLVGPLGINGFSGTPSLHTLSTGAVRTSQTSASTYLSNSRRGRTIRSHHVSTN